MRAVERKSSVQSKYKSIRYFKKVSLICVIGQIDCVCEYKIKGGRCHIDRVTNEYGYEIFFLKTIGNSTIFRKNVVKVKIDEVIIKAQIVNKREKIKDYLVNIENKLINSSIRTDYEKVISAQINHGLTYYGETESVYDGLIGYLLLCDMGESNTAYNQYIKNYEVIKHNLFENLNVIVPGFDKGILDMNQVIEYIKYLELFEHWKWTNSSSLLIIRYVVKVTINDNGEEAKCVMLDFSSRVEYELEYLLSNNKVESLFMLFAEIDEFINNDLPAKQMIHKLLIQKIVKGWSREADKLKEFISFIRK